MGHFSRAGPGHFSRAAKDRYLRRRDKGLEEEVSADFKRLLPEATFYRNVFETRDSTYEHDLIVVAKRTLLAVETKASPPVEPFRDLDKAFQRVSRAFASDRGPQKAYEQARRLWRTWNSGKTIELYDGRGTLVLKLESADIDDIFMVCVTRDEYGPLACDLSLLLKKSEDEPYPWVLDEFALDSLADGWRHLKLGQKDLVEFLRARVRLHGKVFGSDELEYAGFYLKHGFKDALRDDYDHLLLDPTYSDIFQQISIAEKLGGPAVRVRRTRPFMKDIRQAVTERTRKGMAPSEKRQRPNERCACGSGLKFKKCHGHPAKR